MIADIDLEHIGLAVIRLLPFCKTEVSRLALLLRLRLQVSLRDPAILDQLASGQRLLVASLVFDQISAQKEEKIRQWLVEQQSGVMRGLFANMLGELKLSERTDIVIEVAQNKEINKTKHARGG